MAGDTGAAERTAREAVELLEALGDAPALAEAHARAGRHPRHDRRAGGRRGAARAGPARWPAAPAGGRAEHELPRDGPVRARRARRGRPGPREPRGGAGGRGTPSTRRAATRTSPSCCAVGRRRRARGVRGRGPGLHARARPVVARLQPRGAPLRRARAPRAPGRRPSSGLRELVDGVEDPGMLEAYSVPWLGRLRARRGRPRRRRGARPRLGAGASASGCCSASPTPASPTSSGRGWPASRRSRRPSGRALLPRLGHPGAAGWRAELLALLGARGGDGARRPSATARGSRRRRGAVPWAAGDPYEQRRRPRARGRRRRRRPGARGARRARRDGGRRGGARAAARGRRAGAPGAAAGDAVAPGRADPAARPRSSRSSPRA